MRVVDLTMSVSPNIKVFPGSPQPSFVAWSRFDVHKYDSEVVHMSTHTGTHMDAPSHFSPGNKSIDMISADRFLGSALLLKVPLKASETVQVSDVKGSIRKNDTVVLATGWEHNYEKDSYMKENPGLSKEAAKYLVERKVNAVAIDGPSIDPAYDSDFAVHNILLPAGVLVVENLCNLDKITKSRFTLVMTPLKLAGASGSPVRALAVL
jgi:kynurenine formamidase